jgi:CRP-like cAMP-binding protein
MAVDHLLAQTPLFSRLSAEDRRRVSEVAQVREYAKGEPIFWEGDPPDTVFTIVDGRVKVVKSLPGGRELILEILGPGDPLGAVAAYEARPYPASAVAIEPSACFTIHRAAFFALLETCPSLVRGLLAGLSLRVVDLTRRLGEVVGARVDARIALLLLKLADRFGQPQDGGSVLIPLPLTRQELADLTGTTVETAIRTMSRWSKEGLVTSEKDGFRILDRAALEAIVST